MKVEKDEVRQFRMETETWKATELANEAVGRGGFTPEAVSTESETEKMEESQDRAGNYLAASLNARCLASRQQHN